MREGRMLGAREFESSKKAHATEDPWDLGGVRECKVEDLGVRRCRENRGVEEFGV